jgi:hypothetical protein
MRANQGIMALKQDKANVEKVRAAMAKFIQ